MKKEKLPNIFLVDDNKIYLDTLEHSLKQKLKNRVDLKTFSTGEECLKELKLNPPSIVILDYYLNSVSKNAADGLKILESIKMQKSDAQVIMLSSQEKLDVAASSIKLGAFDYVIKNESSFFRITNLVNLIIHNLYLESEIKKRRIRNSTIISLYLIFFMILFYYLKSHGFHFESF
ncbi:MAG TPA: response regulator [Nitrosopumilaceae archaeon]|jgi:two-component system response regulator AtoC|nr:response regulator [Nitrosopumilaceae archaeon]